MACIERRDIGLLTLRLGVGGLLAVHGTQKLFGWFGGEGVEGTTTTMENLGFTPARPSALAAGLGEAGGGALLALGLATPAAGAAATGAMAAAVAVHAPAGFFSQKGGFEFPALLGYVSAALALAGPGRLSLDHLLGDRLNPPWTVPLAFGATAAAAAAVILRRARRAGIGEPEPEAEPQGEPAD